MFDWKRGLMVVAATLCAAGAAAAQAQPRQMGGVGITVFEDVNFRGQHATFRNDVPDLGRAGFGARISSLQIAPGEFWEVCQGVDYRPPCQVFSGTESDLRRRNWNDRVASLRRVRGGGGGINPGPRGGLILYRDESFRGQALTFEGPAANLGSFNDKARSVRITAGSWEVCEDINFGKCRVIDRDWPNLNGLGLRERISSVRPLQNGRGGSGGGGGGFPQPGRESRLVLYDRDRYRGASRAVDGPAPGLGGFGNRAISIQVIGTWELCDGPNFTGRCVTVSDSVPDLATYGLNNRVSSARPVGDRRR